MSRTLGTIVTTRYHCHDFTIKEEYAYVSVLCSKIQFLKFMGILIIITPWIYADATVPFPIAKKQSKTNIKNTASQIGGISELFSRAVDGFL